MAVAKQRTWLPLDRFFQIIGYHPLFANGIEVTDLAVATTCKQSIMQYSWQQADAVGREEIAQAIFDAEQDISSHLGYDLLPTWQVDERTNIQKTRQRDPWQPYLSGWYGWPLCDLNKSVQLKKGYLITAGMEVKTLIDNAAIVYSDGDGDGYKETAVVTIATIVTDSEEIAIYYPTMDGLDEWEIRPIKVSITAGTATITFQRAQCVKSDLFEAFNSTRSVDGLADSNFLATVDVYRHYNDPQQQVQFMWEPTGGCGCGSDGCTACSYTTQMGCTNVRNYRLGQLAYRPAAWNVTNQDFDSADWTLSQEPDRVRVWYRAGWRSMNLSTPNLSMDHGWELAVARLAMSRLDRSLCACETLEAQQQYWQKDLSFRFSTRDRSESYGLSSRLLDNPLGTTRAAIYAWRKIQQEQIILADM